MLVHVAFLTSKEKLSTCMIVSTSSCPSVSVYFSSFSFQNTFWSHSTLWPHDVANTTHRTLSTFFVAEVIVNVRFTGECLTFFRECSLLTSSDMLGQTFNGDLSCACSEIAASITVVWYLWGLGYWTPQGYWCRGWKWWVTDGECAWLCICCAER